MIPEALLTAVLFLLALLAWLSANRTLARSGIPQGRILWHDADGRHELLAPLISLRHGLVGKPDYLVGTSEGFVPVEIKSRNSPRSGPGAGDTAQLTAYCVLVEDATGVAPSYGILEYADRCWRVEYTPRARRELLQVIEEIGDSRQLQSIHRSHTQPARCRACGFRTVCDERIL